MNLDKNEIIKLAKWVIILIILLVFYKACNNLNLVDDFTPKKDIKSDTIIVVKHDTIYSNTIYDFKYIKVPIPQIDTAYKYIYTDSIISGRIYVYSDSLVDSNLVIKYRDHVQGLLRGKDLSYKLKVPIRIIDSVKTTINNTIKIQPRFEFRTGVDVGYNILSPNVEVGLKRHNFALGYNIQTKQPILGYRFTIFRK